MKRILLFSCMLAMLFACASCAQNAPPEETLMLTLEPSSPSPKQEAQKTQESAPVDIEAQAQIEAPVETEAPPRGELYKCRVNEANIRSSPDQSNSANIIGQLNYEQECYLIERGKDFSKIALLSGEEAYCYTDFLVPAHTVLYAYLKAETGQKTDIPTGAPMFKDDGTPIMVKNALVDLRLHLPDAEYELLFATERNVLNTPLYPRAIPLLQADTVKKLKKAYALFEEDGYKLKIYDAYRPLSVQRKLFAKVQNSSWIANPNTTASNHNRGCAVDISLIDIKTGKELIFPTPMHTFSVDSARTSKSWSSEARKNVEYMTKVMKKCGFAEIKSEWWHFADTNSKGFMTTDIDLSKLNMLPKQED